MIRAPLSVAVYVITAVLLSTGCAQKSLTKRELVQGPNGTTRNPSMLSSDDSTQGMSWVGMASFYADDFHGRKTSNGETFDMHALTAAHKTLPFGTTLRVTNLSNGKSCVVRVNDRGPFVKGRMIDLSLGAAKKIGMVEQGVGKVRIEVITMGDR